MKKPSRWARHSGSALLIMVLVVTVLPLANAPTQAQTAEVFFSEYVEGSNLNRALEIYNGTGVTIDLAAGNYAIDIYFNGNASVGKTIDLTGSVADGDVYVVADDAADAAILAETDQTSTVPFFNGDDAVVLRKDTTIIDVIGQIGYDPGHYWGSDDVLDFEQNVGHIPT
jgi:uncharacterized protein